MKVFFLLLFSLNLYADDASLDLVGEQLDINDSYIHQEFQTNIRTESLDPELVDLVEHNENLRHDYEVAVQSDPDDCENDKDKDKKKKKKKKEKGGWVIGAIVELRTPISPEEEYQMLDAPLSFREYDNFYTEWLGSDSLDDLQGIIQAQTADMSRSEYLSYLGEMMSRLPYNYDKQTMQQGQQHVDSLWSMIQEEKNAFTGQEGFDANDEWGGICGDIHFAGLMIGQMTRPDDFEFFTASYVANGTQHVYMFAIDRENPDQAVVLNYDEVSTVQNVNGIESLSVRSDDDKADFNNIGTRVRIFAQDGQTSEHVATVQTALGSFLYNASTREHERIGSPGYQDISTTEVNLSREETHTSGSTVTDVARGVRVIHGRRDNGTAGSTDIVTLAYYRQGDTNTNGAGVVEDADRLARDSNFTVSATGAQIGNMHVSENVYLMQINYTLGLYKTVLRTDRVDIQAEGRMNVAAEFYMQETEEDDEGRSPIRPASGDGDLQSMLGLRGQFGIDDASSIDANASVSHSIGLYEQRSMFSWRSLPRNIRFTPNTVRAAAHYNRSLSSSTNMRVGADYLGSQVGGLVNIRSSVQANQHIVYVDYQLPANGINRSISSNLLPNAQETISLGYQNRSIQTRNQRIQVHGGVTFLPEYNRFGARAGIKVKFK